MVERLPVKEMVVGSTPTFGAEWMIEAEMESATILGIMALYVTKRLRDAGRCSINRDC